MPGPTFFERSAVWLRDHVQLVDVLLAGLIALVTVILPVVLFAVFTDAELVVGLGLTLSLAWRRTVPLVTAGLVTLFGTLELGLAQDFLPANFAVLVTIYSLAAFGPRWAGRAGLVVGLLGAFAAAYRFYFATPYFPIPSATQYTPYGLGFNLGTGLIVAGAIAVTVIAAWALGSLRRIRLQQVADLEERARLMGLEREQELRLAASGERTRIAREMHDVVAHSLSVVIAQADGGRYAGRAEPEAALGALEAIAGTGRQALSDMRGLLGVLRDDKDTTFVPQPDAATIPELVADVRASGLDVDLLVEGEPRRLPTGPGLAAYRIVQESLTNVLKHAGPASRAWVTLRWFEGHLDLSVIDDGRGASAAIADAETTGSVDGAVTRTGPGPGHGVLGMQERATLYGGQFFAAPRSGGGFGVHAWIPYPRGVSLQ